MAEGMNKVILVGNLGTDGELRNTQGDRSVLALRLACTTRYKKGDNWEEQTEWVDVDIWGARADALAKILRKGESVLVEGKLRTESWDDEKSGGKRYRTKVVADNILLLGGKRGERGERDDDRQRDDDRPRDNDRGRDDRPRDDDRGRRDDRSRDDDRGRREERGGRGRNDDRGARDDRGGFER